MKTTCKSATVSSCAGIILLFLSACSQDSGIMESRETVSEQHGGTEVLFERSSGYPLTDYAALQRSLLQQRAVRYSLGVDDFIGCGYKVEYYPLENALNVSYPVMDMQRYERDYPGRADPVAVNQSKVTYCSFSDFDRYVSKSDISSKLSMKMDMDLFGLLSSSAEYEYSEIFSSLASSSTNVVYGETKVSYYADRYSFYLPSGLYDRILDGYLDDVFMEYLYNASMDELFNAYGCFVLMNFISGAEAIAVYKATEKKSTVFSARERNMDYLMSANVNVGSLFSAGLSFGGGGGVSTGDTVVHNFKETAFSVCTYGGSALNVQFGPAQDVNDCYIDMSDWCASLKDKKYHTIVGFQDDALVPLYEFIEEDNLRESFIRVMERGYAEDNYMREPILYLEVTTRLNGQVLFEFDLISRYGEKILLSKYSNVLNYEYKVQKELDKLRSLYPGLRVEKRFIHEFRREEMLADLVVSPPVEDIYVPLEVGFVIEKMKKYVDEKTGKIYLIPDSADDPVYTLYGDNVVADYTIGDVIEAMEPATGITVDDIRNDYRLVAL